MATNDDRRSKSRGVSEILSAVDKVNGLASTVADKAPELGPLGGRSLGKSAGFAIAAWIGLYFLARAILDSTAMPTWLRLLTAILPLPAFLWFLWSFIAGVRDADELERRIQLEALAVAFPLTIVLFMTLGLLQVAVPLPAERWSYRDTWPILYVFYVLGVLRARRRYV